MKILIAIIVISAYVFIFRALRLAKISDEQMERGLKGETHDAE